MNNIQALVDGLGAQWQKDRAQSQMTLGKLIERLGQLDADVEITPSIGEPQSYRGYYSDLAFEPKQETVTAGGLLAECLSAMGQVFKGYKGGDFPMHANTPVWVADYGSCGEALMSIGDDGSVETKPEDD